ncbi:MAG: hypothetical protein EAZ95_02675 [Bacteroidetes bacterium]|nr:MAG: hypothetical protein EAZ95_02675 [Bacteroidota bacterium]
MKLDVSLLKSVLNIYDELFTNGVSLVYLGEFNHEITKMFTSMAEDDMERQSTNMSVKRRVYHVMVETLQNMNRHSDEIANDENIGKGLFMIGKRNDSYFVITSNRVTHDNKEKLQNALNQINSSTKEELKEMYKKQIKEGKLSNKGGAGLGLIDIARKTTGKLDYHFIPYNEDDNLFILNVEINTRILREEAEKEEAEKDAKKEASKEEKS